MSYNSRLFLALLGLVVPGSAMLWCQPPASEPLAADTLVVETAGSTPTAAPALPVLETYADSVAMRIYEASGGPEAWNALPYLRFKFSVQRSQERGRVIHHFWDRTTGNYRLEFPGPGNIPYVALFNIGTREGKAYWQGTALTEEENSGRMDDAYHRFINDTYWLLAPFKLFDPGVNRTYVPDSSNADFDVIKLTFGDVGLTPGDQYWLYADKETGRLAQWSYILQSDAPGTAPRTFVWEDYEEHVTPAGSLFFASRKRGLGTAFAILTDGIETPTQVSEDLFTDGEARLTPPVPD